MFMLSLFSLQLFATPRTVAHQALLSMRVSRQEYWTGLPCLLQGIFPTQESNQHLIHPLHWQTGSLPLGPLGSTFVTITPFIIWQLLAEMILSLNRNYYTHRRRQWHPTPVLLPGKSHGRRRAGGLQSMGSLRVRHD